MSKELTPKMQEIVESPQVLEVMSNRKKVVMTKDYFIEAMQVVRKEAIEKALDAVVPDEKELPKRKCLNAENHLFGSCFECKKTEGHNGCRDQILQNIKEYKEKNL